MPIGFTGRTTDLGDDDRVVGKFSDPDRFVVATTGPDLGKEIEGVRVTRGQSLPDGRVLKLTGARPRYRLFFSLWIATLVLSETLGNAEVIAGSKPAKGVTMKFVHAGADRAKMRRHGSNASRGFMTTRPRIVQQTESTDS